MKVPLLFRPFWPPSRSTAPSYVMLIMAVVALAVNALRRKQSASDKQFVERKMRQIMDQLAQVELENNQNKEARDKWFARKEKLEAHAKSTSKSGAAQALRAHAGVLSHHNSIYAADDDLFDGEGSTLTGCHDKCAAQAACNLFTFSSSSLLCVLFESCAEYAPAEGSPPDEHTRVFVMDDSAIAPSTVGSGPAISSPEGPLRSPNYFPEPL